jgi:hypothetical protein
MASQAGRDAAAKRTPGLSVKMACRTIILLMNTPTSKRLADIRNELERGVFLSVYNSRTQRLRRVIARIILAIKHGVRGTLFSWPLYLLPLAAWSIKAIYLPVILLLLLPGVYISGVILVRGVREDYNNHVEGYLLQPGFPGRLLFPGNFVT